MPSLIIFMWYVEKWEPTHPYASLQPDISHAKVSAFYFRSLSAEIKKYRNTANRGLMSVHPVDLREASIWLRAKVKLHMFKKAKKRRSS